DADFVADLVRTFGDVLLPDGTVDLRKMGAMVFADEEKLQILNKMIHPRVMQMFEKWSMLQSSQTVIMETAIVYEGNLTGYFDKIIVVDAPLELRIRRILQHDPHLTREDIDTVFPEGFAAEEEKLRE
ncbi:MAG: dephospho-CoA kinase, partial [Thermoguttaceae bacterium]|nr:dephospho-CoA kinase [Thermoguttaceae bacterium]